MRRALLSDETDFEGWRKAARALLAARIAPDQVVWSVGSDADLFAALDETPLSASDQSAFCVPRTFISLAETASLHRNPERFAQLYSLLWRLKEEPRLLEVAVDPGVAHIQSLAKSVRRDIHKMRAFVRFRQATLEGAHHYIAWFEPEHYIVAANASFFMRRFASAPWSILTPLASAHWSGDRLVIGPGAERGDAPSEDALEDLWRNYYASIFNPARLKVNAMRAEMPQKYWRNLPEASLIGPLIKTAQSRTDDMASAGGTHPNSRPQRGQARSEPETLQAGSLAALRASAAECRACPLWEPATQTVFGEGESTASVMFVGEQPGDQEDIDGRPFIGPAGRLFDRAMKEAGLDRTQAYVTNAVKHFKFVPRGKRRIHQKPGTSEISVCRMWLQREIELVKPRLLVALGATAAQSLFGKPMAIGANRGRVVSLGERSALITVHPSFLLRLPDEARKGEEFEAFVADLKLAREFFN